MNANLSQWILAVFLFVAGPAMAQEDKPKELDRREEEWIKRTHERSQRPVETERDKLLEELVRIPGPALPKDNFDPWFDSLTGGAEVWKVDGNSPKVFREMHSRIAKQAGARESITREQFRTYAAAHLTVANSPPWRPSEHSPEQDAERAFREGDKDRTRRLEASEMSEALHSQWKKWDKDSDGSIDLAEYTAYFLGRVAEIPTRTDSKSAPAKPADPFDKEDRPSVLRFGKLPKGLPAWFMDWDTDRDGQIGLYEWKAASQPIEEFQRYDQNEDGFIEADECLKLMNLNRVGPGTSAAVPSKK